MTPRPDDNNPPVPRRKKYKGEQHNVILRKNFSTALQVVLEEMLGGKINLKVNSSSITHTDLQPEGDLLTITIAVEFHEKADPPTP